NQGPTGDFGDWLSEDCPQSHPYVQNAFSCTGQSSDVTATSPEGINLDVIGYDLVNTSTPTPSPTPTLEPCYPNFTTAEGCDALSSLMNNTSGGSNTAAGWEALTANTTGSTNTAIGNQALQSNLSNSDHVAIGSMAGSGITSVDNNIIIGHHSGVHSVFGQESDRCF